MRDPKLFFAHLDALGVAHPEVQWTAPDDPARTLHELEQKAAQLPFVEGREVFLALWLKEPVQGSLSPQVMPPQQVLAGLR